MSLSAGEIKWLRRLAENGGKWPDRPFLRDTENSTPLMRKGLIEVVKPDASFLPYAFITEAGRRALNSEGG